MTGPGWTWTEYAVTTRYGLVCPINNPADARPYVLNGCTLVQRLVTALPQPDGGRALISTGWWTETTGAAA